MAVRTDTAILRVAARAAGVCTRAELRAAGVPDRTIADRVRSGYLEQVGPGLYRCPELTSADTPLFLASRAYPKGALSHLSAARLWDFPMAPADPGEPIDVTVARPADARRKLAAVTVHRVRTLPPVDVARPRPGLPSTSPARTIVDLAGTAVTDRRLRHIVQSQAVARRLALTDVMTCLERAGSRGVAGAGRLRRLLFDLDDGQPMPESELEWRLADLLDRRFDRQYQPPWYDGVRGIVDFADIGSRTIVEADGRRWHTTEQAMAEDRRRDRRAAANGWLVLRVTWDDVVNRPEATAAEIEATVATRRPGLAGQGVGWDQPRVA